MNLLYKPDWEETKARFEAWWTGEALDRCVIQVTAPGDDAPVEDPPPLPEKIDDRWLDYEYLRAANECRLRHTFLGGEALPIWNPGYPNPSPSWGEGRGKLQPCSGQAG
jgi:hypothetical protein